MPDPFLLAASLDVPLTSLSEVNQVTAVTILPGTDGFSCLCSRAVGLPPSVQLSSSQEPRLFPGLCKQLCRPPSADVLGVIELGF